MVLCRTLPTGQALQALFARAAVRRAERGVFLRTLREILTRRVTFEPLLLQRREQRPVHERASHDVSTVDVRR